jgi:agmatine deiminase
MTMAIRLPAEWEPQDGILLAWPHEATDWSSTLADVRSVYAELITAISRFETILLAAPDPEEARIWLQRAEVALDRVIILTADTNDSWTRDSGPVTVLVNNQPVLLDFGFNGWGLKFAAQFDNQLTRRLAQQGAFRPRVNTIGLILEGGSIESDGNGTILTTSQCLLSPNRNPQLDRSELNGALQSLLGARQVHWLEHGHLAGDDTDAHIDTLARLCPDDTIVYVACDDQRDEHYQPLKQMEAELKGLRTLAGQPYRLLPLPWPAACFDDAGHRLPATYANFLVINGAVLAPVYGQPTDNGALAMIGLAFPGREVIGIDCRPLITQHGSLHCITMQLPTGVLS